jgi:2-polyprenyl-3-methyl-5-hydroxy-6-metoxy-1,4-benzoquinol methylase
MKIVADFQQRTPGVLSMIISALPGPPYMESISMARIGYFLRSLASQFDASRFNCPNCGSKLNNIVDRKFIVTQLRSCTSCRLLFRTPTDNPATNASFYENRYIQGFTTNLPSDFELSKMKETNFSGGEKDYSYYIGLLTQLNLKPGARIFDYGCSWGYGSYQLTRAGFDVKSFEIAPSRRKYAKEQLGIATVDNMDHAVMEYSNTFDAFFSSHVIEHVPSPVRVFEYAMRLLNVGGLFVSFTPNGSQDHRLAAPSWSALWGEVHPNFIDNLFLDSSFSHSPRAIGSSPVKKAFIPDKPQLEQLNGLNGDELFFAARKISSTW